MSNAKRKELATGRGAVGKTAVQGGPKQVRAKVVEHTDAATLQGFGPCRARRDSLRDDFPAVDHDTVKHTLSEYDRGDVHTNGIEGLVVDPHKRAHKGIYHK